MLFSMALLLAAISVAIEVSIVRKLPFLHKVYRKGFTIPIVNWKIQGGLVSMFVSMSISLYLGGLFGMSGLTAGIAGILSTVASEPTWMAVRAIDERPHLKAKLAENKAKARQNLIDLNEAVGKPAWKVTKLTSRALWMPCKGAIWAHKQYQQRQDSKQPKAA